MPIVKLESSPQFVIEMADGKSVIIDPYELLCKCQASGAMEAGRFITDQARLVETFKQASGLASLTFTQTLIVINAYQEYIIDLEKTMPWSQKSPKSSAGKPSTASPSQGTLPTNEPSASTSIANDSEPVGNLT